MPKKSPTREQPSQFRLDIYTKAKLQKLAELDYRSQASWIIKAVNTAYDQMRKEHPDLELPPDPVIGPEGVVVSESDLIGRGE